MLVTRYLSAAGATDVQKVSGCNSLYQFKIGDDRNPVGRLSISKDGLSIWHPGARAGLKLPAGWTNSEPRPNGDHCYTCSRNALMQKVDGKLEKLSKFAGQEKTAPAMSFPAFADSELLSLAGSELRNLGWESIAGGTPAVEYWKNDLGDKACRLTVMNRCATVFSHKEGLAMPAPWRSGRLTSTGNATYYIPTHELTKTLTPAHLSTLANAAPVVPPMVADVREVDRSLMRDVIEEFSFSAPAPADHYQLNKSSARLDTKGVRVYANPDSKNDGAIMLPIFRFEKKDPDSNQVELCGVQNLFPEKLGDYDKLFEKGSISGAAFSMPRYALVMPNAINADGNVEKSDLSKWLAACDKTKPLILCEGYASGMALEQAGCGSVIGALSASNLPIIAAQVKKAGLDKHFNGVVIAGDLDTKLDRTGQKFSSKGIPAAIEAAKILDAKVALANAGFAPGTDARDILGVKGADGVREYAEKTYAPDSVMQREDLRDILSKKSIGVDLSMTR